MLSFIKTTLLLLVLFAASAQAAPTILVTGDSISAAYGIALEEGWVALLQQRLKEEGYPHEVMNTSVSGETSSGALARLYTELKRYQPEMVIIELGGNDGLRGLPLEELKANLLQMVQLSQENGSKVLLLGMRLPSNYGEAYTENFHETFKEVATASKIPLVPFMLSAIALKREMFQDDGVHPTVEAQPILLDTVWPELKPLLKSKD